MSNPKIEDYTLNIWSKLDNFILQNKLELYGKTIILSFLDGKKINDLTPLEEISLENPNLNFQLEFKFFLDSKEEDWENIVDENYQDKKFLLERINRNDKNRSKEISVISKIKELTLFFEISDDYSYSLEKIEKIVLKYQQNKRTKIIFCQKGISSRIIKLSENNRIGWIGVWKRIKKFEKYKKYIKILDETKVLNYDITYTLRKEDDVSKLRYFLPLWHYYNNCKNNKKNLTLLLTFNDKDKKFSTEQFFSFLPFEIKKNIFYSTDDNKGFFSAINRISAINTTCASDIFPLTFILPPHDYLEKSKLENFEPEIYKYIDLLEPYLRFIIEEKNYGVPSNYNVSLKNKEKQDFRDKLLFNILDKMGNSSSISQTMIKLFKEINSNISIIEFLKKAKSIEQIKKKISRSDLNLFNFDDDSSYSVQSVKDKIIDEIITRLKKLRNENEYKENYFDLFGKLNIINKLTFLIYLFELRNLLFNKVIFKKEFNESKEVWLLNEFIINKTWIDSKSYAEGFYQLIENSLKHSKGHVAFFGMRIYNCNPYASMSLLYDNTKRRDMLWNEYWNKPKKEKEKEKSNINSGDKNNIFNLKNNGKVVFPDFLEFFVLDNAIENDFSYGILDSISKSPILNLESRELQKLGDILKLEAENYIDSQKKNYYIQHYGIRWFSHYIEKFNGIFEIYSPYNLGLNNEYGAIYNNIFKDISSETNPIYKDFFSTEYAILIPLSYEPIFNEKINSINSKVDLFIPLDDFKNFLNDFDSKAYSLTKDEWKKLRDSISEKCENREDLKLYFICELNNLLKNKLFDLKGTQKPKFLIIQVKSLDDGISIEIFSKALFGVLYDRIQENKQKNLFPIYIDIEFISKELAMEFIRIFAIFYTKNNINDFMHNVQVAICTLNNETNLKEVNFIFAGKKFESTYATANNFVYYDADASLEFLELLKFFNNGQSEGEIAPILPFDLLLKNSRINGILESYKKFNLTWFEEKMLRRLETEMCKKEYGCKISNVKVRLGSKILVDTFYEAELLFHNLGTVKRFAYLIALQITKDLNYEKFESGKYQLFLLGYENYSAILIQEICSLLNKFYECYGAEIKVSWLIDTCSENFPVTGLKFSEQEKKYILESKSIFCITIFPLGSTMTTIYKLKNSFERGMRKIFIEKNVKYFHYSILAIGDAYMEQTIEAGDIYSKYISSFDNNLESKYWHSVILKQEKPEKDQACVKFLLPLKAKWEEPLPNSSDLPMLKVDKTSTLLDTYFQAPLQENILKYYKSPVNIELLKSENENNYIKYGHIVRGDNHYQFYFDFIKLSEDKKDGIEEKIKKLKWKNKIKKNVFNIVISPLQSTNAVFLKLILDNVFCNNLHLLHINIQETGKENVRTKFNYISKEIEDILRYGDTEICFYYVDDAVCTGSNLARALKFINTICNQYQETIGVVKKFTKVFLLLNRSSFETAQTYVDNPEEDWLGVINLCVPSYNTHMEGNVSTCPSCKVKARYDLLRKRSATNKLYSFFEKGVVKYEPRDQRSYDLWLKQRIELDSSYFEWLYEYLYFEGNEDLKTKMDAYIITTTNSNNFILKSFFEHLKNENDNNSEENLLKYCNKMIADENYLRLSSIDSAYRELIYNDDLMEYYNMYIYNSDKSMNEETRHEMYEKKLKEKIIHILEHSFPKKSKNRYEDVQRFNSYIKVISRDYLAKNFYIKKVMYGILEDLFKILIGISQPSSLFLYIIQEINKLDSYLQYRIFKVILHRLALMRSEIIICHDNIKKSLEKIEFLTNNQFALQNKDGVFLKYKEYLLDKRICNYLASIKTATMEENNDNICQFLLDQTIGTSNKGGI